MTANHDLSRHLVMVALSVTLGACSVSEPYSSPEATLPGSFSEGDSGSVGEVAQLRWWENFNDRQLTKLVERGLDQNLSIQAAQERFAAASAVARGAGIAAAGGLDARGGFRGGSDEVDEEFATGAVNVSWLADFFGELSGERSVAAAQMEAAGYGVEAARLAFLAELSTAYINARFFQNSLELTRQTLASREETLELTQRLVDASAATVVDLQLARGLVDETQADIPGLAAQFRIQSHRAATLLGQPASSLVGEMSRGAAQPTPRNIYRSGVPADLMRNRPDIRIAERDLAAAVARIGVARADLYPSISLTGRIAGTAAGSSADEVTWGFGPVINLPIFGRAGLEATVSQREAAAREALLVWQNVVLRGVEEVENALVSVSSSQRTVSRQERALETWEESLRLAQEAYSRGERSVLEVLDAERQVAQARIRLAEAQRQYAVNFVELNVAIGSGRGLGPIALAQPQGAGETRSES